MPRSGEALLELGCRHGSGDLYGEAGHRRFDTLIMRRRVTNRLLRREAALDRTTGQLPDVMHRNPDCRDSATQGKRA